MICKSIHVRMEEVKFGSISSQGAFVTITKSVHNKDGGRVSYTLVYILPETAVV